MQPTTTENLSATAAQTFLESVPEKIRLALQAYAEEINGLPDDLWSVVDHRGGR